MPFLILFISTSPAVHRDLSPLWALYHPASQTEIEGWVKGPYHETLTKWSNPQDSRSRSRPETGSLIVHSIRSLNGARHPWCCVYPSHIDQSTRRRASGVRLRLGALMGTPPRLSLQRLYETPVTWEHLEERSGRVAKLLLYECSAVWIPRRKTMNRHKYTYPNHRRQHSTILVEA